MGLFRRRGRAQANDGAGQAADSVSAQPVWLPGDVEVPVAGESFHAEAIEAVRRGSSSGLPLVAVLTPEQGNPHDEHAVAVHVNGQHVGYLPREVAGRVQLMLVRFASEHGGRLVSCPAQIRMHQVGPQVVLLLDPGPVGAMPGDFQVIPDLDAAIGHLISRLDEPIPALGGVDAPARAALVMAEEARVSTEADYDRRPGAWQGVEREFRRIAGQLTAAHDPFASLAWLGVGRSSRYQKGRRDNTLRAFIDALYWDRGNVDAWCDLADMASAAPYIPTLLDIFSRIPFPARPKVLRSLLAMSHGHDRLGNMSPVAGAKLRSDLLVLAESQGDKGSVAILAGEAGLAAETAGDLDAAVQWWRRAIAAGTTDEKVADRFSIWLTKRHEFSEARMVLRQAIGAEPQSAAVADRLRRRLARCEQNLPGEPLT